MKIQRLQIAEVLKIHYLTERLPVSTFNVKISQLLLQRFPVNNINRHAGFLCKNYIQHANKSTMHQLTSM